MNVAKKIALKFIERSGYVVLKQTNFTKLDRDLRAEITNLLQRSAKLERELERARAQAWEPFEESRRLESRLAEALDENRRLKIHLEEAPQIDYQVLMKQQDENAKFCDTDAPFMALYERVKQFSMTSLERLYAMYKTTEYVSKAGIAGSIVQCGVLRWGSMMM